MQVEKRHYGINLLLLIAFYLSFLPCNIPDLPLLRVIVLNILLYTRVFSGSKLGSVLLIGSLIEVISSGLIGGLYLNYLIIKNIIHYARNRLKFINSIEVFVISGLGIAISICLELSIKRYLGFHINYNQYQFIGIVSLIILITAKVSKII